MAKVFLTAQNIDIYDGDGRDLYARTGSTSVEQVSSAGACGVILGHPETGDSPKVVKLKLNTVLDRTKTVLPPSFTRITLMAGESWEDFQSQDSLGVAKLIAAQISSLLSEVPENYAANFTIGYDPKWGSKGSGHDDAPPPEPDFISGVAKEIRSILLEKYGKETGSAIPIIYGGRSTPERTLVILADSNIDGLILGSACDTVQKTQGIIDAMKQAKPKTSKVLHANFKAINLSDPYEEYARLFRALDDSFTIYISPSHSDLRAVVSALVHEQ